jgi:hypothetical protein
MELVKEVVEVEDDAAKHPGCVKRVLSVRDRLLIFQALNQGVQQGGSPQALSRLVSARELLDSDGVDDYYEVMDLDYAKAFSAYSEAFKRHLADPVKNADPGPRPKQSEGDKIGHCATYWIKAKLDAHISDALKVAKFDASNAAYVVSLFKTYGIAIEE